ncbi:hypothetical protein L484_009706 [Morus notabilis]|uniref:Uncharacterized protein n=1 Tax=Morus notabilis TaxID=981085 RepID=W9SGE7_9ROSA|nr:hypothetical protein L484_009706 [Morus notabilis]
MAGAGASSEDANQQGNTLGEDELAYLEAEKLGVKKKQEQHQNGYVKKENEEINQMRKLPGRLKLQWTATISSPPTAQINSKRRHYFKPLSCVPRALDTSSTSSPFPITTVRSSRMTPHVMHAYNHSKIALEYQQTPRRVLLAPERFERFKRNTN